MENLIKSFFKEYQELLDSIKEIEKKQRVLKFDIQKIIKNSINDNIIPAIIKYSNIHKVLEITNPVNFYDKILDKRNILVFGTDHGAIDFAIEKATGKIIIIDSQTHEKYFAIAKNQQSFLAVLIKFLEFNSYFILENKKINPSISKSLREETIKIAGGVEYEKFYNHIIISDGDCTEGSFILE